jgi:hypothetical protein
MHTLSIVAQFAAKLSDFAENAHISVFWTETAKNEVRNFSRNFRVWRNGGKLKIYFQKSLLSQNGSNFISKYTVRSEIGREL